MKAIERISIEFINIIVLANILANIIKLANSNVDWEAWFPVSVAFTPATLPSKQTAQAAAEHKQEVKSLNLNFS